MSGWKKLAVLASFAGAGAILAASLVAWGLYGYSHRSFRKDWPPKDVPKAGLRASLRTELRSGKALYRFTVESKSADFEQGFARIAEDASKGSESFTVTLLDAGDFELCRVVLGTSPPNPFEQAAQGDNRSAIGKLAVTLNDSGKIARLESEGALPCSPDDYAEASKWDLSHDEWEIVSKSGPPPGYREVPIPKSFVPDNLTVIPDPLPAEKDKPAKRVPDLRVGDPIPPGATIGKPRLPKQ